MKKLLVVVHGTSAEHAVEQTQIAIDSGANGVILINHVSLYESLFQWVAAVKEMYRPDNFMVGMNALDLRPMHEHLGSVLSACGNDIHIQSDSISLSSLQTARQNFGHVGKYFGGVAFKYQKQPATMERLLELTREAAKVVDVVTTSGEGTGEPASVDKVRTMKSAIIDSPLALASGVSEQNIMWYMPYVDYFLVNTSISYDYYHLDPAKVANLARIVNKHNIEGWL